MKTKKRNTRRRNTRRRNTRRRNTRRRNTNKKKMRSKRKSIQNKKSKKMILHQIFFDMGKGKLKDIQSFYKCHLHNKKYCKKHNITYKLWSRKQIENLLNKSKNKEYKKLYYDFDQDIQRVDFGRYLLLWNYGGLYLDLDICIIKNKSIKHLFDKDHFFVKWADDKRKLPYNAALGTKANTELYKDILDHCKESYYEKRKQNIYKKWKGRFVFQTTGHYMLQRVLKKHKISDFLNILKVHTKSGKIVQGPNPLFEDANASVWYTNK